MPDNLLDAPLSLKRSDYKSAGVGPAGYSEGSNYPSVNIDGPQALRFPECALVTFRVKRGQVVARSAGNGQPASASVQLELCEVVSIEESESDENEGYEAEENPIDKLFAQAAPDEDDKPEEE